MRIWDLHCHLSGVTGKTPDERIAELMTFADRMGVERMIFFMGYGMSEDPSPERLRFENDQVLQAISHWHDRAFAFCYVNPKHVDASLGEMDRCIKNGPMLGIKLWVAARCSDASLDPIIRKAAELKAVIYQHTWFKTAGNKDGESTPLDLVTLAARFPDVPIICGHTGGDWELGIRAVRNSNNLSIDTAGNDPTSGFLEMAVRELGVDRIIYGSDIGGRSFSSQLAKITGADIADADKQKILSGNLRRLMQPILAAKGIRA